MNRSTGFAGGEEKTGRFLRRWRWAAATFALIASTLAQAESYIADPAQSSIGFSVRNVLVRVSGRFTAFTANLDFARQHVDWPYIQHPTPYPGTPMTVDFERRRHLSHGREQLCGFSGNEQRELEADSIPPAQAVRAAPPPCFRQAPARSARTLRSSIDIDSTSASVGTGPCCRRP